MQKMLDQINQKAQNKQDKIDTMVQKRRYKKKGKVDKQQDKKWQF